MSDPVNPRIPPEPVAPEVPPPPTPPTAPPVPALDEDWFLFAVWTTLGL